jgi:serine/threonine protein kinase
LSVVKKRLSPDNWRRARDIYAEVMDAPEQMRETLAQELCNGDSELESEMRSLLLADVRLGSFLASPAAEALHFTQEDAGGRELRPGVILAERFHILRLVNSGGMGAVYEAWDSELQEVLAVKTIRPEIASVPAVIERFKREVKQARQVAHSNICRVYDLFNHEFAPGERIWFLTMQLLKGTTLLEHIRQTGPFTSKAALALTRQMVEGLTAAHAHGIVHRDFKSTNVMLVPDLDGQVRAVITDFGLASPATDAIGELENLARQGTPAYAAPEQWFWGIVSPASDQYSLGVVLCEMLTGERPEPCRLQEESLAPVRLPAGKRLEHRWEAAIQRCLNAQPEKRFRSLSELLKAIDPSRPRKIMLRWGVGIAAGLVVAGFTAQAIATADEAPTLVDVQQITPSTDYSVAPALSSNGRTLTYMSDRAMEGNQDVWVQDLTSGQRRRVTTNSAVDDDPTVSNDGKTIVFASDRRPQGIYLAVGAGQDDKLLVPDGHSPSFSPTDQSFVYWIGDEYRQQPGGRVYRYDFIRGESTELSKTLKDASYPMWNSDGSHVLMIGCGQEQTQATYPDCEDWWVTSINGGTPHETGAMAVLTGQGLSPSGYFGGWQGKTVVFSAVYNPKENGASLRASPVSLWSIDIDPVSGNVHGQAKPIFKGDNRDFVISSSMVGDELTFCQMYPAMHVWRIDNATNPTQAKAVKVTQDPEFDLSPRVTADGRWLVVARGYTNARKIYRIDIGTGAEHLVDFKGNAKLDPLPNATATEFAFESTDDNAPPAIYLGDLDGDERRLCTECRDPSGWVGTDSILYGDASLSEVRMMSISGGAEKTILRAADGSVRDAVFSERGKYLAFAYSRPKTDKAPPVFGQIFAMRFPAGAVQTGGRWIEVTSASEIARKPTWSEDGKTLFYLSNRDGFWCVWGQHFNSTLGELSGKPFPVYHFHDLKLSPGEIKGATFNLSATGDSLYLNVVETNGTIWAGKLVRPSIFSRNR